MSGLGHKRKTPATLGYAALARNGPHLRVWKEDRGCRDQMRQGQQVAVRTQPAITPVATCEISESRWGGDRAWMFDKWTSMTSPGNIRSASRSATEVAGAFVATLLVLVAFW